MPEATDNLPNTLESPAKKQRKFSNSIIACTWCKRRKQKCNGDYIAGISCSNCIRANVPCKYDATKSKEHLTALHERIVYLEKLLRSSARKPERNPSLSPLSPDTGRHKYLDLIQMISKFSCPPSSLLDKYNTADNLSKVRNLLQSTILNEVNEISNNAGTHIDEQIWDQYGNLAELLQEKDNLAIYLDNYYQQVHRKFPFLSSKHIDELHKNASTLCFSPLTLKWEPQDAFIILMVYAVGSRMATMNASSKFKCDNRKHMGFYWHAVNLPLPDCSESRDMRNIHTILMLVVYFLRFPNGPKLWDLAGYALKVCISYGYHREDVGAFTNDPLGYLLRSRTFWSAYSLERIISHSFKKPYSISDLDIDLRIPVDIDESVNEIATVKNVFYHTYPELNRENFKVVPNTCHDKATSLTLAIHFFRLRRIDSEIQTLIYRVDKVTKSFPRSEICLLQKEMREWINTIPDSLSSEENDYCLYLFSKQIRTLIQPFLDMLPANDPLFIECMNSSISICKLSKRMHQSLNRKISVVSLQTTFLSGVTIIYGLISKSLTLDQEVDEGLQSCKDVLSSFASISKGGSVYNNLFDLLVERVYDSRDKALVDEHAKLEAGDKNDAVELPTSLEHHAHDLFGQISVKKRVYRGNARENVVHLDESSLSFDLERLAGREGKWELNLDDLFDLLWKTPEESQDWWYLETI